MAVADRWPPVYSAEDLAHEIMRISRGEGFEKRFYAPIRNEPSVCQGDVIRLQAPMLYLEASGEPYLGDDHEYWMVIGNTCDFDRSERDAPYTQLIPILELTVHVDADDVRDLRHYKPYRLFYLPPWAEGGEQGSKIYAADFTRPIPLRKSSSRPLEVVARLDWYGWALLHCCLVRFLARDDGREDSH